MPYQNQKSIAFPGEVQERIMSMARDCGKPAYQFIEEAINAWLEAQRSGVVFVPTANGDAEPQS